jgi:hypothetical protein
MLTERHYKSIKTLDLSRPAVQDSRDCTQEVIMRIRIVVLGMLALGSAALLIAAEEKQSKIAPSPAYDKMKMLVGSWDGTANESGKPMPVSARFQLIAGSSVLAGWLGEGTPHEMVTMFHMDGNNLMATHYCAAHNQPRLALVSGGDPNRLVFKFKDGTNIQPDDGHMQQVAFTFDGSDRHGEDWTWIENGKEATSHFDFKRKQ